LKEDKKQSNETNNDVLVLMCKLMNLYEKKKKFEQLDTRKSIRRMVYRSCSWCFLYVICCWI